jgi:hypothetical protein
LIFVRCGRDGSGKDGMGSGSQEDDPCELLRRA